MAMSPHDQHEHEPDHAHRSPSNGTAATSTIATNRWGPYSGAGDFASNMAVILAALLAALALALALNAAVRYLLRRHRRARQQPAAAAAAAEDPEKPPVQEADPPPPPPALVYSARAPSWPAPRSAPSASPSSSTGHRARHAGVRPRLPRALHRAMARRRPALVVPDLPRAGRDAARATATEPAAVAP